MNNYYIQTNVICIALLLEVLIVIRGKKSFLPARRYVFARIIFFTMVLCLSDIFAWASSGETFAGAHIVVHVSNMIYFAAMTVICALWLEYVLIRIKGKSRSQRKYGNLVYLPSLVMMILIAVNPYTEFLFSVSEENVYSRGPFVFLHWLINWGYLLASLFYIINALRKAQTRLERSEIRPMLTFIIFPAIGSFVQMICYGVTAAQCGITLSIVMIMFEILNLQISSDPLTGLNNRRSLDNYIHERLRSGGCRFTVLMCDIDKFKSINDTYGHTEGDLALQAMADILKKACGKSGLPLYLCRYGGDEFLLCGIGISEQDTDLFRSLVSDGLARYSEEHPERARLNISIGESWGLCMDEADVERICQAADKSMYKIKAEHKKNDAEAS